MPRQLTFDLPLHSASGRQDFFISPSNATAIAAVEAYWPQGKLVLSGPKGSGKSHLARVWAGEQAALFLDGTQLADFDPGTLDAVDVAVDDADLVAGHAAAEQVLFHLHNAVLAAGGRLLLTGCGPPYRWPLALADLASRVAATATTSLAPPDDKLLSAVLVKLFTDRQLVVSPAVIAFITPRIERSLAAAQALVTALDARALAERRRVTRAMAAEWLDIPTGHAP